MCLSIPALARAGDQASSARHPRILLRSSWQTVNIGDIAHTPGILALLEQHLPGVDVVLWPMDVGAGVEEMLLRRFPRLRIAKGSEAEATFGECDFFIHGSGPSLVGRREIARWIAQTGKPYGIYGITTCAAALQNESAGTMPGDRALLDRASFAYFRDSASLEVARTEGVACPVMGFAPDAAFATDLRDDARAEAFLAANGLQKGQFLCCIPRLRHTPYWLIKPGTSPDPAKQARNEAMKEHDHVPLRLAIVEVVRKTGMKVLICPEDRSQMAAGKELLLDPLPDDVKSHVIWRRDYWLTDEALSTYVRSAGLFGNEMHSPIMCIGNGIPAIVCRWAEQTTKGFMWQDIGLGDWLFDLDREQDIHRVVPTVLDVAQNQTATRAKAEQAHTHVRRLQAETMGQIRSAIQSVLPKSAHIQ